ncbi:hypothetical protein BGZ83_001754 [Gryganskiella cystojenkinii]|nr:hypothetical protein BGZ83_001754 [Gryganskiella cystojenkinii]
MQFKTLALAAVAIVAVSAQAHEDNPCSQCVYASFPKDTVCAALPAANQTALTGVFLPTNINITLLSTLVQDPAIKNCVCHWATNGFTPTGSAYGCGHGAAPVCNATQLTQASDGINGVTALFHCGAAVVPSGSGSTPSATTTAAGSKPTSAGVQMNIPYVVSIAAVGLAALVGL